MAIRPHGYLEGGLGEGALGALKRSGLPEHVTVAVIGAGPAGCAAAVKLAQARVPVVLLDQLGCREWRVGESLPPSVKLQLEDLGIWQDFLASRHAEAYGNRSIWGTFEPVDYSFMYDPHGNGWHLDRAGFDRMMVRAARQAGVSVSGDTQVLGACASGNVWQLVIRQRGVRVALTADVVIDATGRSSWFARRAGAKRTVYDRLVAIFSLLVAREGPPECNYMTLIEAVEHGWWYSAPVPGHKLVVVYMTDHDLLPTGGARLKSAWASLLRAAPNTRARCDDFDLNPGAGPRVCSARSQCLESSAGEGWLAIGDAAQAHDPLSSQGILSALASGQASAVAIQTALNRGERSFHGYRQATAQAYRRYLIRRSQYYSLERRWPRSLFWSRRRTEWSAMEPINRRETTFSYKSNVAGSA